jgi:serine/threonine-protein kinase
VIGSVVGSWKIEERLGEGGMGTVYAARHTVMGRRGAVKVLKGEMAKQTDTVQRFFNEARAAAAIENPGIVDVFDMGQTPDGTAYLVMELLDGESLAARLRRTRAMAPETAARLARQIAAALAAAHERGIVHRDLKPDNIFLVPDPETTAGERVKLLDFGIAKLHGELAADAPVTHTGALFGTPVYMSPEQCKGGVAVDHRADLYALGCILYQMLCGRVPFLAAGLGELLSMHMFEKPVPPRAAVASVPEALEGITLCLLEKDPAQRFASARAVCNALDGALGKPLSSTSPGASQAQAMPVWTGGPTMPTGGDAALPTDPTIAASQEVRPIPTTLGGAAGTVPTAPPAQTRRRGWMYAVGGLVVAGGVAVAIVLASSKTKPASTEGAGAGTAAAAAAGAGVGVDAGSEGVAVLAPPRFGLDFLAGYEAVSGSTITAYISAGAWDSAAEDFEQAARQPGAPARWTSAAKTCRAWAAVHRDELDRAKTLFDEAIALDATWAIPQIGLSGVLSAQEQPERAIEAAHAAQRLAPRWWMTVAAEARVHRRAKAYDRAIEQYRRALLMAPEEPILLSELALVYHASHLDTEAERYARDALARDPDMVAAHLLLAERALERKNGTEALAEANRVVALDPESATGLLARADALQQLHKSGEAKDVYTQLVALLDRTHDKTVDAERAAEIRASLTAGKLPPPRRVTTRRSGSTGRRSGDTHRHSTGTDDPLNGLQL